MIRLVGYLLAVLLFSRCTHTPAGDSSRPIVFLSDYGEGSPAVAVCKGVILQGNPRARIFDVNHRVPTFSRNIAARTLAEIVPHYPKDTIFLVIVDPYFQGTRPALIAKTKKGHYLVLPNNGLITGAVNKEEIEDIREITNPGWKNTVQGENLAYGKDLLCPAAARLSLSTNLEEVGPRTETVERLPSAVISRVGDTFEGTVESIDFAFGNAITNFTTKELEALGYRVGDKILLRIGKKEMVLPYVMHHKAVPKSEPLLLVSPTSGKILLAISYGSFSSRYNITSGTTVTLLPNRNR